MFILRGGRRAFLEYLRNTTPQGLLLGLAFLAGRHLDLSRTDFANWPTTVVFFASVFFFFASFAANTIEFLNACTASLRRYNKAMRLLTRPGMRLWRPFVAAWIILFRREPLKALDLVAPLLLALVLFVGVLVLGVNFARASIQ
ncbi:MAG: hypothetical protein JSR43_12215 [Proteobacteria bacterium]|nr:hypothetical protein [Pseudomonadota bacterium]